jgi:site-specific recombinase XerD
MDKPSMQKKKIKAFTRFVSQHLKKLAIHIGLPESISTIWARHSFATKVIRSGNGYPFAQEALGHSIPQTTTAYFAGMEDKVKKEFAQKLMDFR